MATGATFRDFFASQAPTDIPEWFKPSDVPDAPEEVYTPDMWFGVERPDIGYDGLPMVSKEESDTYNQYYQYDTRSWTDLELVPVPLQEKVNAYIVEYDDYVYGYNHWEKHYNKERFFQWRYFYADEMLLEREGGSLS